MVMQLAMMISAGNASGHISSDLTEELTEGTRPQFYDRVYLRFVVCLHGERAKMAADVAAPANTYTIRPKFQHK